MSAGFKTTFQHLTKTENEAAVDLLVATLDSPHAASRQAAVKALLDRRSPEGHRAVFQRLADLDESSRAIINERPERLSATVTERLQDPDLQTCQAACDAIVALRLFGALPDVISVLVEPDNPRAELMAQTALKLAEAFYAELSGVTDQPRVKQQDVVRSRVTAALEDATRKFHRHQRLEAVEAFLLIAKQRNVTLRQLLQRTEEVSHQAILDVLSTSRRGGVLRLLLGFLEDSQMPHVVLNVISERCDRRFVDHLLRAVGSRPSRAIIETLPRFNYLAWAEPGHELLEKVSSAAQEGAVRMLMGSSLDRQQVLNVIGHLLLKGRPIGRRAAARGLAKFEGEEANSLAVKALDDEDPEVQATIIRQIRLRKIPGAFSMLIDRIDSLDDRVHEALREAMPEFTLRQFLANFDSMPDLLQSIAGHIVRRIDSSAADKLIVEMKSMSPVRRRRAVQAAGAMGLTEEVESTVIKLLSDDDHMVRVVVAKALAECETMPTWEALRDALFDRSVVVQEAAEQSLERISRSLLQRLGDGEQDEAEESGATAQVPEEETEEIT
ncbi:MAG: HEAT repeat domain-containing protein [Pirellulales bacterium]|nr:HEAT repeat domain-containing protein [Pirellulales bacterium]